MAGWHHWLNGREFEQAPRVGDGQGSLACCSPWGHKESDKTERLNWAELIVALHCRVSFCCMAKWTDQISVCVCVYIYIYICPLFWISFPFRSPQNQLEFPVALKIINRIMFLSFWPLCVDSGNASYQLVESTDPHTQCLLNSSLLNEWIYKIP